MGNMCLWCFKKHGESQSNGDYSGLSSSVANDRTPLLGESNSYNDTPVTPVILNPQLDPEISSDVLRQSSPIINGMRTSTETINQTDEFRMASVVEDIISKLIDVGNSTSNMHQTIAINVEPNTEYDNLKQLVTKSLSSIKLSTLPDVGLNNISSLLSQRPISSDICSFVAYAAGELSNLLTDEIKIVHKEDLVVAFE